MLVDTRPREAKFTPDGKEVWVSSEVGGTISVIDTSNWKVKKKIGFEVAGVRPELLQPVGIEFTKDNKNVFVALGPGNRVAVIDPKTYEVKDYILVGQRPWHLELSPDHSKLYVANGLTNDMTIIDVASLKAEKSVPGRAASLGRRRRSVADTAPAPRVSDRAALNLQIGRPADIRRRPFF